MHINRKNRILNAEEDKLDYLSGVVDTEGSIMYSGTSIRLVVANTDIRLHRWLKRNFGGNYSPGTKVKGWKQAWYWSVHGNDAYKIFKKLEGKLILKNEQLLLDVEMYERVTGRGKKLWAKTIKKELIERLKILNATGVDKTGILRPDNEIKIKNKLAYLAGYIDGDGTIGITKDERTKPARYHHHMSALSTDRRSLEWTEKNFGGAIRIEEPKREEHAKRYRWKLTGKNAYKLIKELRDHLMLKQGQADAAIKMYEKVTKWDIRPRPAWATRLQEKMFQRCKELNKRGDDEGEITTEEEEPETGSQITFNHWE